jgi:hypothetical protein
MLCNTPPPPPRGGGGGGGPGGGGGMGKEWVGQDRCQVWGMHPE